MTSYFTKLGRGEAAWFIHENKVVTMPVGYVSIKAVAPPESSGVAFETVTYGFRFLKGKEFLSWHELNESLVFATKEELLASL